MVYVGIDLHRKRSHVAALDETGAQLLSRRIVNDPQTFLALLEGVGECRIALEATYGWEWLADVLQDAGYELHLAHPMRTKAIASARVKTDAVDARTLAHLLRADLLPEAYIAPRELRDLRDLLRHRVALTRMRSALKHRVSAILAKHGIQRPYSDLFGPGGTQFLTELELRDGPRRRLDSHLALIADFTREIDATSREIDARAKEDPYVEVLCQIRGVGRYIAMLVIAEVGDVTRFATARRLCSWAGLTPTVRSSDGKARLGHVSSQGSRALRWALVEAAQHAGTGGGPLPSATSASPSAAASRSPRSPSRARSSRSASTACATERSVAWHPGPRRARSDHRRSAHDPPRRSCAARPGRSDRSSELGCCQWPPLAYPGDPTAAHLIEPSSVARHNRPAQRDRTDDSDATAHAPAVSAHRAPHHPSALTAP
jgi:transposase